MSLPSRLRLAILALVVALVPLPSLAKDGMDDDGGVDFKGVVTAKPADGLVGDWTIGGRQVATNADTKFDTEHGMPVVGATVEVRGTQASTDAPVVARKIEVKAPNSGTGDMPNRRPHSSFESLRSTPIILSAPTILAPWMTFRPIPPNPNTITLSPAWTFAVFTTAPTPVVTPQPI